MPLEPSYTLFDAALILLREGMEALLVLVALLALVQKNGQAHQSRWIWLGSGLGLLASVAVAVGIHLFFHAVLTPANQELLEGITGVGTAVLLFSVSVWLHSRSAMGAWQNQLRDQTTSALAEQRLASLAFLAFVAVFREGSETVLFYLGIAPAITPQALWLGLGLGALALAALASLMIGFGIKLPLRPFFRVTSGLVFYLGLKFAGSGIHALQQAGVVATHGIGSWPKISWLSFYPTWETLSIQAGIMLAGILVVFTGVLRASSSSPPAKPGLQK